MIILLLLLGFYELETERAHVGRFFAVCRTVAKYPRRTGRGRGDTVGYFFFAYGIRALLEAARAEGIPVRIRRRGGLPHFAGRVCRRPGLVTGAVLAAALLVASQLFLFRVEIEGNEAIGQAELYAELEAAGLRLGCFLPRLNTDAVETAVRLGDNRISYVAVNLKGTVAHVQIREVGERGEVLPPSPAHLVAKCDGVVVLPLAYEGKCLVREGDVVRAGQMLVSGLIETDNNGVRVSRAGGEVWARTVQTYTVHIPFVYEEKVYTGRTKNDISILFFSLERKIFKTAGKMGGSCDIIEEINRPTVGGKVLPVGLSFVQYREYELREARYTPQEACAKAYAALRALLYEKSEEGRILSRSVETVLSAEGVTLVCTVTVEENIAEVAEFTFGE